MKEHFRAFDIVWDGIVYKQWKGLLVLSVARLVFSLYTDYLVTIEIDNLFNPTSATPLLKPIGQKRLIYF